LLKRQGVKALAGSNPAGSALFVLFLIIFMRILIKNKTPIIVSYTLCNLGKRLWGFSIGALAIFPFIIVRDEKILNTPEYINHESIHIRQYIETLLVGIIIIGALQYLYALLILRKSRTKAYYFMSHEQEAHQNDTNLNYLKERKLFSYYKYLLSKNKKEMDLVDGKRVIM
jgi:hypothetical protein